MLGPVTHAILPGSERTVRLRGMDLLLHLEAVEKGSRWSSWPPERGRHTSWLDLVNVVRVEKWIVLRAGMRENVLSRAWII